MSVHDCRADILRHLVLSEIISVISNLLILEDVG